MKPQSIITLAAMLAGFMLLSLLYQPATVDRSIADADSEETGPKPTEWFFLQRAYPYDHLDQKWRMRTIAQARALRALQKNNASAFWQPIGPTNIGGRITAIAVHTLDPDIIYIGAAAGGVFKSYNGGVTWQAIFDAQPSLSIGALALDPSDPETIYVGTGEANGSFDSYPGDGVYKSTDGGASWRHLGLVESHHIGRIVINPRDPQIIYVAACGHLFGTNPERGIYKSRDGGQTWERSLFLTDSTAAIDVDLNPLQPDTVYAAMWERVRAPNRRRVGGLSSGIYRTSNGGASWELLTTGLPAAASNRGRIGLAVAPSRPATIYAIYANDPGFFDGLYKSTNYGESWQRLSGSNNLTNLYSNFGWYFATIRVDPEDADVLYALGVSLFKSSNGGNSFSSIQRNIHVDQHALAFDPYNSERVWVGNDGGFYLSTNAGGTWSASTDLPITQFYAGTIDFLNPQRTYGGAQDNGTMRTRTGRDDDWEVIYGGDGFHCLVDYSDANYVYAEYQYGGLGRSSDGGNSFQIATNGIPDNARANWSTPVVMDPQDPRVLYYGAERLYRTADRANSWTAISGDLTNGPGPTSYLFGTITTLAVSPLDPEVIYVGTDDAQVWVTTDLGAHWTKINAGLPQRWVTRVAADPHDVNVAYVTFSGHQEEVLLPHIFRTSDQGASWSDLSANLPEAPINDVIADPDEPARLYVGTDVGVFYTTDLGASWQPLGTGMPFVPVHDLMLHQPTRKLRAATHGRSFYEFDLNALSEVTVPQHSGPEAFVLHQNYPNPIHKSSVETATTITFALQEGGEVQLQVFDVLGRAVAELARGQLPPGTHRRALRIENLRNGTYFYRLTFVNRAGKKTVQSRKFTVLQ